MFQVKNISIPSKSVAYDFVWQVGLQVSSDRAKAQYKKLAVKFAINVAKLLWSIILVTIGLALLCIEAYQNRKQVKGDVIILYRKKRLDMIEAYRNAISLKDRYVMLLRIFVAAQYLRGWLAVDEHVSKPAIEYKNRAIDVVARVRDLV